jgi:hypothetical protein
MSYTLKLGTTASLRFENAINESQALEQLKSAFPGLTKGIIKKRGFYRDENNEICNQDEDEYYEPEIKLIENV